MKKLLVLSLLALLTGCVQYYYPETALEDGVYYAEDDPKYVVYRPIYPDAYYPWASLDYFYMGYHPYPRFAYYYGFPYGLVHGYDPWYYPYYRHPYYSDRRPYGGYCSHYGGCGRGNGRHANGQNRYADNASANESGQRDGNDSEEFSADSLDSMNTGSSVSGLPYTHYVSTTPSGYSGNRGMVIRSNEAAKVGESKVQPSETSAASNGIVIAGPALQSTTPSTSNTGGSAGRTSSPGSARPATSRPASSSRPVSRSSHRARSSRSSPSQRAPRNSSPVIRQKKD